MVGVLIRRERADDSSLVENERLHIATAVRMTHAVRKQNKKVASTAAAAAATGVTNRCHNHRMN